MAERSASEPTAPVRLIATDLDGTLVGPGGEISDRTRQALLAAEEAGIVVVFVTGRPLRWARDVFAHVGGHGQAVVANGALVWDVPRDAEALVRGFAPDRLLEVAERLRAEIPGTHFAVETTEGIGLEPGFQERYPVPEQSRRAPVSELADGLVLKLLARHEELGPEEYYRAGRAVLADLAEVTWSSAGALLEISAPGVTKASTLELLAAGHQITAAGVVAFGDMPNDLEMLAWAGRSYAMANGHPDVRAAADRIAPRHDEDGVAQVIEELLGRATGR